MAQSFHTYLGDDATQQFAFTKGYINTSHISAIKDGISVAFTWVNATLIDIDTPLLTGEILVVKRTTPRAPLSLTDFSDGNSLPASDLDRVLLQSMYVAQETDDVAVNSILLDTDNKYNANSKIIKNITDGSSAQDAVTKAQLDAAVIAAGNVTAPANPADDNKSLIANAGAWAWGAAQVVVANITNTAAFMKTFLLSSTSALALTNLGVNSTRAQALGDAATRDTGITIGLVPVMTSGARYPAADGSLITALAWDNITGKVWVDVQTFTASGTWTRPASATWCRVRDWGAGGSGAKGQSAAPGGGGGGGGYIEAVFLASALGATETVTIGAGGAAVTAAATSGNNGGNSTFGAIATAYGGAGGIFSVGTVNAHGGGGGGALGAGSGQVGGSPTTGFGGGTGGTGDSGDPGGDADWGGGGAGGGLALGVGDNSPGGDSVFGGGGGGGGVGNATGTGSAGGTSLFGGNGGAGGYDSVAGTAGTQPGGGGGGSELGDSGAGADGKVEVISW